MSIAVFVGAVFADEAEAFDPSAVLPKTSAVTCVKRCAVGERLGAKKTEVKKPCTVVEWVSSPVPRSKIRIRLILPEKDAWNGMLYGMGGAGRSGYCYPLAEAALGYAVVNSDLGSGTGQASNTVAMADFAWRSAHVMTVEAKKVIEAFYARKIVRSVFEGGSTGGGQGIREASEFPEDYDAIFVVSPCINRINQNAGNYWKFLQTHGKDGTPLFDKEKCETLQAATIDWFADKDESYCRGKFLSDTRYDKVAADGVLDLAAKRDAFFADPDIRARLHRLWEGPVVDGKRLGFGQPMGGRVIGDLLKQDADTLVSFCWSWHCGEKRKYRDVTWKDFRAFAEECAYLNMRSCNLSKFRDRGGKLIVIAGGTDRTVPQGMAIEWYERMVAETCGGDIEKAKEFARLYVVQLCGHGNGRCGLRGVAKTVLRWAETGEAPGRQTATGTDFDGRPQSFPVAVYPMKMSGSAAEGWKEVPMRRDLPGVADEWWYPAAAAFFADASTDFLAVPRLPAAVPAPKVDGYLDDAAWSYAGSLPQLIRGNFMGRSGELPPHAFRLAYDDENLYLGFNTRMPGGSSCVEGVARTEKMEPDAWGSESWEFFVTRGEHMYRFAGNYAGGTCESKYPEFGIKWNGKWDWAFSKAMNIDDSVLWQGEVAIPWTSLDSEGPFDGEIRFNFCRSWTLPTCGTISSFNSAGRGYTPSGVELPRCPRATFDGSAAYRLVSRTDPARGEYAETYELSSVKGGPVAYEAAIVARDGTSAPKVLHRFETTLPPGGVTNVSFAADTSELGYDAIVRTLRDGGREVMRETVPYDLDRRVFDVTPLYLKEKVRVTFRRPFDGRFEAVGPDGKSVFARACSGKAPFEFAFPRGSAAGTYVFRLVAADGSVAGEEKSDYPGIGDWEKQDPHYDWVLPPYEPLRAKVSSDAVDAALSMRRYVWRRSYLPVAMTSQGEELLAAPPEVLLGDERIGDAALAVTSNSATHVGFTAKGESALAAAENAAWLEYDGVQYNRMTVTPRVAGRALSIRYRLGPAFAKYLHASAGGQWGSKRTERIPDGRSVVGAFPILWTGNEEKGLCFFYQSRTGWTAKKESTYLLEKSADGFTVTVAVAEDLPAGEPFAFEFGFVASPARPLAPNYPYDTLHGSSDASHLNRPGCPVQDVVLMSCPVMRSGDLGSYFCDLDDVEYFRKNLEMHRWTMEKHVAGETVRPVPYACARFLSSYYPEVRAFLPEWTFSPECALDYSHTGHFLYECCPASSATDFFIWKYKTLLGLVPGVKGIYLDFGLIHECSNKEHGCHESMAILGQREFYRRLCVAQIEAGITNPVVVIHSTDCVQLPAMTFVTHLFNGEHVRQMSSTLLHDKKDILDTYGIEMFACELSTLPWGMSNSIYMPYDTLEAKNGGDEPTDAYEFRMGLASIGAGLVHNTVQSLHRNHYGLFDKVIRAFRNFGVGRTARFVGYWRNPVKVVRGRNAYVSCHTDGKKVLAVIAHIGREHEDQDLELELDPSALGLSAPLGKATDLLSADDPDYRWLYERKKDRTLEIRHAPLDLGDFGTKVLGFDGRTLRFRLPFHRFALVELK